MERYARLQRQQKLWQELVQMQRKTESTPKTKLASAYLPHQPPYLYWQQVLLFLPIRLLLVAVHMHQHWQRKWKA